MRPVQGLEKVEGEHPDVIIIGTVSPRRDAFMLHKEIKDNPAYSNIPMLVIDACPEDSVQKGWRRAEGLMLDPEADYMAKPVNPDVLLELVDKLLKR